MKKRKLYRNPGSSNPNQNCISENSRTQVIKMRGVLKVKNRDGGIGRGESRGELATLPYMKIITYGN